MGGTSQTKPVQPSEEEEFEVLDIRGTAKSNMSWLQDFVNNLTREPAAKQVAVGGLSGWVVGYLSMKVGKVAATVVGGSMLIMQLAAHKGYIKVDWNRVNRDLEKNAKKIRREVESNVHSGAADENILQDAARKLDKKFDKLADKVDRQVNTADSWFNKQMKQARKAYRKHILGDNSKITVDELYWLNMYIIAFSAGTMLGVGTAKII